MTDDDIIAVVTARKEGKTIESRNVLSETGKWRPVYPVCWNFADFEYRVKPEPRRVWIKFNSNGSVCETCHLTGDSEFVEFLEVIE